MTENTPHPISRATRGALAQIAEAVYIVDVVVVGMLAGIVVLAGINPFHSAALTTALLATAAVLALHHMWFVRHRDEIQHDPHSHTARDRRGF